MEKISLMLLRFVVQSKMIRCWPVPKRYFSHLHESNKAKRVLL